MSIGLIPVGRIEKDISEMLKDGISVMLHRPVLIGEELPKPDYAFNKCLLRD